jgi:hypothetical protein
MSGSGGGGAGEGGGEGEVDGGFGAGLTIMPEELILSVDCIRPIVDMPPMVTAVRRISIIGFPSLTAIYSAVCLQRVCVLNDYEKVKCRIVK